LSIFVRILVEMSVELPESVQEEEEAVVHSSVVLQR
jgi:hypothetical protein